MSDKIRVLVVGCGTMGSSHARAYDKLDGFEVIGLVARGGRRRGPLAAALGGVAEFDDFAVAMEAVRPDAVSINTWPDTHASMSLEALRAGAHVFVEKPLASTVAEAGGVVALAGETGRKVVVGYILQHHPAWGKFIDIARTLGTPLVMRMNLNQQSAGSEWAGHKHLMDSASPIVDCGVHYVDVMCQMTRSTPVRVHAIGARLSDEIKPDMYNYGQLQVIFADGSVGWYEAGWGPMMSETAYFVKDVIGPKGSVSIVKTGGDSADVDGHTQTGCLLIHHAELDEKGLPAHQDESIDTSDEPDHQALCEREQAFFLKAIREDVDLSEHLAGAVDSLRIVLAADESIRTGRVMTVGED